MIVCIIAEGSYPYITGGVSSWIHSLINGLPDIQFKLISIMPDHSKENQVHYEPPVNLIETKTIYLNDFNSSQLSEKVFLAKNFTANEYKLLNDFIIMNDSFSFKHVIKLLNDKTLFNNTMDFLKSDVFWNGMLKVYNERYESESFNDFFWTYRSIFVTLIYLLETEVMDADVYHSVSTGYAGFLGSVLKIKSSKKYMITEHGIYPREREEEILKADWVPIKYKNLWIEYFFYLSKLAYQNCDQLITLFKKNEDIQHKIGAEPNKTKIIHNAVDLNHLPFRGRKDKGENYIVGAVLRVTPIKDVMTLLRSFKIVKSRINNVTLEIIGPTDEDDEYFEQCLSLVQILGISDFVTFTGRVDVKAYYNRMDVLVLTSISEGQPLVILEAMAVGIPIVATDVGSCRELVMPDSEESCGIITRLVNPLETANAVVKILNNPDRSYKMALNGRKRVEDSYKKSKFIESYQKIYKELGE